MATGGYVTYSSNPNLFLRQPAPSATPNLASHNKLTSGSLPAQYTPVTDLTNSGSATFNQQLNAQVPYHPSNAPMPNYGPCINKAGSESHNNSLLRFATNPPPNPVPMYRPPGQPGAVSSNANYISRPYASPVCLSIHFVFLYSEIKNYLCIFFCRVFYALPKNSCPKLSISVFSIITKSGNFIQLED